MIETHEDIRIRDEWDGIDAGFAARVAAALDAGDAKFGRATMDDRFDDTLLADEPFCVQFVE